MLGWTTRYEKIISRNPQLNLSTSSILEVGSGAFGIARFLENNVTGLEPGSQVPGSDNLNIVNGSILEHPFEKEQFDYTICVDVLEHIKPEERAKAVANMCAITKKKVIIACPIKNNAERCEAWLAEWYIRSYGRIPSWLNEHLENGLPSLEEIIDILDKNQLHYCLSPNEGLEQHYAAILLDQIFPFNQQLLEHSRKRAPYESPVRGSEWDLNYSYIFEIHKDPRQERIATPKRVHRASTATRSESRPAREFHTYSFFHNKPAPVTNNITHVQCGRGNNALGQVEISTLCDIPLNAERLDNRRWSELSGIYKIWLDESLPQVIGLSHYRRFLLPHLAGRDHITTGDPQELSNLLSSSEYNLAIRECATQNVIYIPKPLELGKSIYWQYSHLCNEDDLCIMLQIASEMHPECRKAIPNIFATSKLHAWNISIMPRETFTALHEFIFGILLRFEKIRPKIHANHYQARDISFLAERLSHLWYLSVAPTHAEAIVECPIVFYSGDLGD